jgi:hypothetical protein
MLSTFLLEPRGIQILTLVGIGIRICSKLRDRFGAGIEKWLWDFLRFKIFFLDQQEFSYFGVNTTLVIFPVSYSGLSKAELYAKCKMLLSKPCADRSYCPGKDFWAESGRLAALAGRQQ